MELNVLKDITDYIEKIFNAAREGINAVREAKWQREGLPKEICEAEELFTEIKAMYEGNRVPASRLARAALKNLKNSVVRAELEITKVKEAICGLQRDVQKYQQQVQLGETILQCA